jgi:NAD(P)H-nitrite reductase large subunit
LIATGGKPIKLPMKGLDEVGYVNFIKYDDAKALDELAVPGKTAMVIGGGFIGLKAAEALIKRGVRVELVEKADWVLSTMLDKEGASLVQAELAANGVSVRTGVVGESAVRNGDGAISVALSDGTGLVCDFIVVAVGVLPNTEVVKGTDIEVDRGILVDETMATSVPGVYAAGDVAQALDAATGQRRVSAILPNASIQGKTAGKSMAGEAVTYAGAVPFNAVGVFGISTISMGSSNASGEGDEVFTAADSGSYRRIVVRDGKVLGALFVNELERAGIVQGLIRLKADISDRKDALIKGSLSLLRAWPSELRAEKLAK